MSQPLQLFFYCLLLLIAPAYPHSHDHNCIHDSIDHEPEILQLPLDPTSNARVLQSYSNIRIMFDFSTLTGAPNAFVKYLTDTLLPPAQNFLQAALKVKPVNGKLQASSPTTCGGLIAFPEIYTTGGGVNADLVIFLTQTNEPSQSFIAYAGACNLDPTTYRPVFGRLNFNMHRIPPSMNDVQIERDTAIIMHELTHVLGFSNGLYQYYINPETNVFRTGHVFNKVVNGLTITVLNLEPLTTRLRNYYNCLTLDGAYLENQGGSGSAGSHFERRVIYNDYMTASAIKDTRISEFSLALLEGTGWYQVDYSLAEPVTYGKNKGCSFFDTPCMNKASQTPNFEEFCSPLGRSGCSWTYRGAGICGSNGLTTSPSLLAEMDYWGNKTVVVDSFTDNCPTYQMYASLDCEDPSNQARALLKDGESYAMGSKCFMGTLYPRGGSLLESFGYCFKPTCELKAEGIYLLKVNIGRSTVVSCTAAGDVNVPGYTGKLTCPDPTKFCTQINAEGFCRRSCSARGKCVNRQCQCVDGWTFNDCSRKTYVDNCPRCASGDPSKTSCYGDSCECNPSNITCMCQLGLLTGAACTPLPTSPSPTTGTPTKTDTIGSGTGSGHPSGHTGTGSKPSAGTGSTSTHGTGPAPTGSGRNPSGDTETTGNTQNDGGSADKARGPGSRNNDDSVSPGVIAGIVAGVLLGLVGIGLGIKLGIKWVSKRRYIVNSSNGIKTDPLPDASGLSTQRIGEASVTSSGIRIDASQASEIVDLTI